MINGQPLGVGGYLDIGLIDTMEDLFVNFIGAAVFSVIGFFYVRSRGKGVAGRFIPRRKRAERDFLKIAREQSLEESENKVEMGLFVHRIVLLCAESPLFLWFQRVFPQTERQVFHNIMEV